MAHKKTGLRVLAWLSLAGLIIGTAIAVVAAVAISQMRAELPSVDSLRQLQLSEPLRIYTRDGQLIGEFGAERRATLTYAELPPGLVRAFLAAEDDRFFEHPGVDWQGLMRAVVKLALTGEKSQGGSTITMQLARNVFLSSERTYTRKFKEILLALKVEKELTKEEILELYLNKIYLGERAYGVGAAALVYFGKPVGELSLSQIAVIAGLPKAPSRDNPVANPKKAVERRNYVLRRMRELGNISELEYQAALAEPVAVHPYQAKVDVDAHYVAEMVRAELFAEYGEDAYTRGLNVVTTIDSKRQKAANTALRHALFAYDERHGWRGAETRIPDQMLAGGGGGELTALLDSYATVAGLVPAVVTAFAPTGIDLLTAQGAVKLAPAAFEWAGLSAKKPLQPGDVVRLRPEGNDYRLAQLPQIQGAFVAVDPDDGAIQALVGGLDFFAGKFNRVIQARRQAGSGFKPFLYSAAMNYGFTPASVILDAPVVFDDSALESTWRPENYGGDIKGPMRLREALVQSRNLVSIRLLQAIGLNYARDYIPRFGLPADRLPNDLTMALGSAVFTPLEMARGYSTIANGGFVIDPYFIDSVRDNHGSELFRAKPKRACEACLEQNVAGAAQSPESSEDAGSAVPAPDQNWTPATRTIDPRIIWLITDILHDVATRGTAAKVRELGRSDLGGKTGTTNDETDAWFSGFQRHLVAVTWVGFDQPTPLGRGEVGGRAALPAWMDFMRTVLKDVPEETLPRPDGLVNVRIDPNTGRLAAVGDPDAIFETVQQDHIPEPDDAPRFQREQQTDLQDLF
ncbi:penicillin-binding protein 1A [Sinimarinibacterium sp. CAU 1509]|uniref:penicillin-binding protein 1A n=1 Tax=Sinimarinibacterium sp. CAU 1509 TaxID=2562283 RepID=UPI0010ABFB90|nr:penicillin-binding protein 1A [Sinimarinibacterium sp. CAU 1509]TJY58338.1 penicillin-binding protein 1A [Sinimarinibacterium sp. CAU 1509]